MTIPDHLDWKLIEKKIASGAQGTVHLVYHKDDPKKTPRALKILNRDASKKALRRFQKEIKTVAEIDHHAVIEVLDYSSQDADFQYLVMLYHEGAKTIENLCITPNPSLNPFHANTLKCLNVFEQLISAIHACETQQDPIFHRDISPKNILILPDETIRLIDFGLCHTVGDTTITLTGENVGTRYYAPPECEADSEFEIGTYTDIYSAAKVLWSTIMSRRVFDREEPIQKRRSMQEMFPQKEETWHLDRIFKNIIRYNPDERIKGTEPVLLLVDEIRHAVTKGIPPLETIADRCPSCKRENIGISRLQHQTFGGYMDKDLTVHECTACGFIFARRHETLNNNIKNQFL